MKTARTRSRWVVNSLVMCAALSVAATVNQPVLKIPSARSLIVTPTVTIPPGPYVQYPFDPAYQIPRGIAFADFNGDGLQDIVLAPGFPQHLPVLPIAIWLNNGDGTFRDGTVEVVAGDPPLVWNPTQLLVGDFNRDGRSDVFFVNTGPEFAGTNYQNVLLLSRSDGKYIDATANIPSNDPAYNHQGGMADTNGDGNLDIVINAQPGNYGNTRGVKLFYGDGRGGFQDATKRLPIEVRWMPDNQRPGDLVQPLFDVQDPGCAGAADMDGDGKAEVITGSYSRPDRNDMGGTRTVRFHKLGADGNYAEAARVAIPDAIKDVPFGYDPPPPWFAGLGCSQVTAGEFFGSGRNDLLVQWEGNGKWYQQILRNEGNFRFTDVTLSAVGSYSSGFVLPGNVPMGPGHFRLVDVNSDGRVDLVGQLGGTNIEQVIEHVVKLNDGSGRFVPWVPKGPAGTLTATQMLSAAKCATCQYLPMVFDTNNSGMASLVLMDFESLRSNGSPQQTTGVYLTNFQPNLPAYYDRLFNWAEVKYPQLFAPHATTQLIEGFRARAYPGGIYLGEMNGEIYVYGPSWGGLLRVGKASDFLPQATADGY